MNIIEIIDKHIREAGHHEILTTRQVRERQKVLRALRTVMRSLRPGVGECHLKWIVRAVGDLSSSRDLQRELEVIRMEFALTEMPTRPPESRAHRKEILR